MICSFPLTAWPESDRAAWKEACRPTVRLSRGGRAAHMRPRTRSDLQKRYGYYLRVLLDEDRLDPTAPAGAQVTPDNIEVFITRAQPQWSSVTLAMMVFKVRRMAEIVSPARKASFEWLRDLEGDLRAEARPKVRRENVTSDELLEAGENLFREAQNASHLKPKKRARLARDGLMIALLSLRPLRRKNFTELTLGSTLRPVDGRWWIVLEAADTKEGRVDEKRVPEEIERLLEVYLRVYRPILLSTATRELETVPVPNGAATEPYSGRLWITVTGQPITDSALCAAVKKTTEMTLGIRLSPHAFRRAAKATTTLHGGSHPQLAEGVLHHSAARVGEEHYDSLSSRKAALALTAIVRALTREGS